MAVPWVHLQSIAELPGLQGGIFKLRITENKSWKSNIISIEIPWPNVNDCEGGPVRRIKAGHTIPTKETVYQGLALNEATSSTLHLELRLRGGAVART